MKITNRGKKWEMLNSLWMLWSLIFPFNSIGFFIIGFNTRNRKWKIIACSLLLTSTFPLSYLTDFLQIGDFIVGPVSIISYIIGIRLSFKYRMEYLIRRDMILNDNKNISEKEVRDRIIKIEYNVLRGELNRNSRNLGLAITCLIMTPIIYIIPSTLEMAFNAGKKMGGGLLSLFIPEISKVPEVLGDIEQRM